jgi:hypothetical protein
MAVPIVQIGAEMGFKVWLPRNDQMGVKEHLSAEQSIRLHIVAPDDKRDKVMKQIKRPVFSLLEYGALYTKCTFPSYIAIESLASAKHLSHMNDSIIEEHEEFAEEF